jgi:hypothetical protein
VLYDMARRQNMTLRDLYNLTAAARGHWVICGTSTGIAGIVNLSRVVSSCRGWRGGPVQRSPWHAYRAAPSEEKGAKKVDSTELS